MIDYRVYLVTDNPSRYTRDWRETIVAALEGGVTCVQYRDTESSPPVQYARVRQIQDLLKSRHIPLVINNDASLAAAVGAEGIHVGQTDRPPAYVRQLVGPTCEIGLSITCLSDLATLASTHAPFVNCLGIGPVYDARKTKADAAEALGPEGLAEIIARASEFPNCAIGGITLENAERVLAAGARGLAVVSAFSQAKDPYETARNFRLLFDHRRF